MKEREFRERLNDNFIIFGSGFVAELFMKGLVRAGLEKNLRCVVETNPSEGKTFHGLPVMRYSQTDTCGMPVMVCVHDSLRDELELKRDDELIYVYPFIWDLIFDGYMSEEMMSVETLIKRQNPEDNWIYVRYAAVIGIKEDRDDLKELYLKLLSLHCSSHTAKRRLLLLERLAESIEEEGFRKDCPVLIDEDFRIIDGLHRIASAAWFGVDMIPARIYRSSEMFEKTLSEKNRLTDSFLYKKGLDKEKAILDEMKKEIMGKWKKER